MHVTGVTCSWIKCICLIRFNIRIWYFFNKLFNDSTHAFSCHSCLLFFWSKAKPEDEYLYAFSCYRAACLYVCNFFCLKELQRGNNEIVLIPFFFELPAVFCTAWWQSKQWILHFPEKQWIGFVIFVIVEIECTISNGVGVDECLCVCVCVCEIGRASCRERVCQYV